MGGITLWVLLCSVSSACCFAESGAVSFSSLLGGVVCSVGEGVPAAWSLVRVTEAFKQSGSTSLLCRR